MKLVGQVRNRSIGAAKLFQHAAPGRIRQRSKRSIEAGFMKLNHKVQCITYRFTARKRKSAAPAYPPSLAGEGDHRFAMVEGASPAIDRPTSHVHQALAGRQSGPTARSKTSTLKRALDEFPDAIEPALSKQNQAITPASTVRRTASGAAS